MTASTAATSSYINIPPPFDFVYSAGGPTGEVHRLEKDGSIGEKVQEFLFVPPGELEKADKSRVALVCPWKLILLRLCSLTVCSAMDRMA
jgi:carboxy-cis,cis-muconate cyclase